MRKPAIFIFASFLLCSCAEDIAYLNQLDQQLSARMSNPQFQQDMSDINTAQIRSFTTGQFTTKEDVKYERAMRQNALYQGNCPCPYSLDAAGNQCGGRSADSRSGGASPICY